jgi:hypothetical protein
MTTASSRELNKEGKGERFKRGKHCLSAVKKVQEGTVALIGQPHLYHLEYH